MNRNALFLLPMLLLPLPTSYISGMQQNASCDISAVDFSNRTIETQNGRIEFRNGSYTQKDDLGKPDWLFTLSQSTSLLAFGKDRVRIIRIDSDHLSGSGSWALALGFACSGTKVKKVLELWSYKAPAIVQKGDTLYVTVWKQYRGAAPPGGKKTNILRWTGESFVPK
jgi:hypothetical protein